ncbi:MAG: hypothetical protein AAGF13_00990 [Pseudomonadota bacterium]
MRWFLLFVIIPLAACNTPTPQFYGVVPVQVEVGGATYRVFRAEDRAQVIRLNAEMRPNFRAEERITDAIQIATGCEVVGKLKGDVVLANARIDCGDGARPWPTEIIVNISCEVEGIVSDYFTCETY